MTKGQEQVKEFMEFFGQESPAKPIQLPEHIAAFRARFILEEAFETITKGLGLKVVLKDKEISESNLTEVLEAGLNFVKQKEVDLKELADGLADLAYVGPFGTAVATGIDLEPIQDYVHKNNMSKAWKEEELSLAPAGSTVEYFGHGLYRVKRADSKVLKSPSYKPADVGPLIEAQINPVVQGNEDIYADCVSCPNCQQSTFSIQFGYCNSCGAQSYEEPA